MIAVLDWMDRGRCSQRPLRPFHLVKDAYLRDTARDILVAHALRVLSSKPGATCKQLRNDLAVLLDAFDRQLIGKLDHILAKACKKGTLRRVRLINHTTHKKTWRYFVP